MLLGALLGAVVLPLWHIGERRLSLSRMSRVFPVSSERNEWPIIHLRASFDEVMYGEHPPTLRGYTHTGDVHGLLAIYKSFENLPVRLEFDYFTEIDRAMKNVVVIGASSRSEVSHELGRELYERGIRVHGVDEHAYYRDRSGREYRCEHKKTGRRAIVTKDVGILYRRNAQSGVGILLCGGIHTFGSQAAAEVALMPDFQRRVQKSGLAEFIQFITVDVIDNGDRAGLGIIRQSIRWDTLPLEAI